MPDATAETTTAASAKKPPPADRVGEELADDASIWPLFDKLAREDDERRTKTWDNGLNNLALFAGLFSAVTTAFIIEAQQDLEPDYAQMTFLVLNATAFGEKPVNQPFVLPSSARTVTCLWVASLILSLSAALIAIMGKDWIGMYTARPACNLRQWAEMRSYRLLCVERWYMPGVIAAAPVLLHVSLILFGAGLVLFISSDPLTHHLTLGLSLVAGGLYLVTALSAVIFSASPFKSPATQMARAALSALYSYISTDSTVIYRRQLDPIHTLVRELNAMLHGGTASLPGGTHGNVQWYAGPRDAVVRQGQCALAYMRKIPAQGRTVRNNLRWSRVRSWVRAIASSAHRLSYDWFLSSTWTDLPVDRRPELVAEALSWLSDASQAPDVFRAIVFALGDLDVGPQVGKHTSVALRTRLRAEIRRTWQQVDFLLLCRYVLADRNTPDKPVLEYDQFQGRFNLSKEPALRCEDGLAAVIIVDPGYILPRDVVKYYPEHVQQPRMLEFLLPHMRKLRRYLTDVLILLSNKYRTHLWTTNSFNLGNLEAHLYKYLDTETRNAYATAVTVLNLSSVGDGSSNHSQVKYGGTAGAIELLTFLCCHGGIEEDTKPAAVELVMELLHYLPPCERRCLAYLFGTSTLWDATWKDKYWEGISLHWISACLQTSCRHPFRPSSVRTLSDDREFDFALARTAVMVLSPHNNRTGWKFSWIKFLFGHLCQSPLPSLPDDDEKRDIIRLILENAALLRILGPPDKVLLEHDIDIWSTTILAEIIHDLGHRLRDPNAVDNREQLLAALVNTEVKRQDGEICTWDLGEWLTTAPEILQRTPSSTSAMQGVHDALCALYPLCENNSKLRVHWNRIGYPGRPGDIFSDPFLDIGQFFASAEAPPWPPGIYYLFKFWDDDSEEQAQDDEERAPDNGEPDDDKPDDGERDPNDDERELDDEAQAPDDEE